MQARPAFLKKSSKKLLVLLSRSFPRRVLREKKVFWFFFSKKNCLLSAASVAALVAGCVAPPPQNAGLVEVGFDQLPGWQADHVEEAWPALVLECRRLALLPVDTALGGRGLTQTYGGRAGVWLPVCQAARAVDSGDAGAIRRFFEASFQPYRVAQPGLFTGYYEPEVEGALVQGGAYQTPVLARPTDLVQAPAPDDPHGAPRVGRVEGGALVPYWTRADIMAGRATAARPLLWLADPVDLFFLQVQGSGRVRLPDGALVRLGYDGKNGRPYTPIGRVLEQQQALASDAVTMQSVRGWLTSHPGQAAAVMDRNEDYVFFRVLGGAVDRLGPPGALGVELLPGRTAAVDRAAVPLGTPIFLDTTDPVTGQAWRRLLLAQDVGSDIVGAWRADVFLGAGALAERQAGEMHQAGVEYVLVPRPSKN